MQPTKTSENLLTCWCGEKPIIHTTSAGTFWIGCRDNKCTNHNRQYANFDSKEISIGEWASYMEMANDN